jgi:flagellar assembly protein FliH
MTTTAKKEAKDAFRAFNLGTEEETMDPMAAVQAAEQSVQRFLFAYDFNQPEDEKPDPRAVEGQIEDVDAEPEPPPPMFTEEDLDTAREEGRVLGHAQGLKDAEESALHFLALAVEAIADQMGTLHAAQEQANAETHKMAAALSMAVVNKILPSYMQTHGIAEIEALVTECLPHVLNEPRLILRVAPANEDGVRERIEPMARNRGFDGSVVVMADPALGPADCRLEWDNGGAERRADSLMQKIQAIVDRNAEGILTDGQGTQAPETAPDME